jgi:hypothetical protein
LKFGQDIIHSPFRLGLKYREHFRTAGFHVFLINVREPLAFIVPVDHAPFAYCDLEVMVLAADSNMQR